jgi:DNA-directed RNA polymerase specialized sigma24 family protein
MEESSQEQFYSSAEEFITEEHESFLIRLQRLGFNKNKSNFQNADDLAQSVLEKWLKNVTWKKHTIDKIENQLIASAKNKAIDGYRKGKAKKRNKIFTSKYTSDESNISVQLNNKTEPKRPINNELDNQVSDKYSLEYLRANISEEQLSLINAIARNKTDVDIQEDLGWTAKKVIYVRNKIRSKFGRIKDELYLLLSGVSQVDNDSLFCLFTF